jgi:hypothetical protein
VLRSQPVVEDPRRRRRIDRLGEQLSADREALARWMRKLRRSFHEVEKLQARIGRREKQLAKLNSSPANS